MEILDFFKKKQSKYLLTLLILNNINAGCKKKCVDKGNNDTKKKQNTTQSSVQSGGQEKPKGEKPDLEEETEEEKKKRLEEEEKKKKEEEENKKTHEEIEKETIQKLEEERLNKKADEIKYFFEVLNKIYLDPKNKVVKIDNIINASIDENGLKEAIKYFENLNFNDTKDKKNISNVFTNLYNIFNIKNIDKKNEINKISDENIFHQYLKSLVYMNKENKILIIKNKNNNEIHFLLQDCAIKDIEYNNDNYDILEIVIHNQLIRTIEKSADEKNKYTDVEMYLAIDLSKNRFVNFNESLGVSKKILNYIEDSKKSLPKNVCYSYPLYLLGEKIEDYYFKYTNNYIYSCSKNEPNTDNLYDFEHIIKIETTDDFYLKFSEDIGKKESNLKYNAKYNYKNVPFSFETFEKIHTSLEKLTDFTKINEVQNDLLKLVKEDKIYSGQYITKLDYVPYDFLFFQNFDKKDIKNTTFPYNYNVYIYNDNNETKVDIKNWEDNKNNKNIIKNIDEFKKDFDKVLGNNKYNFSKLVLLFKNIMKGNKSIELNGKINAFFSQLLSDKEWDELNKSKKLDNLCIKIANDLSSIVLGKDIEKDANYKVFLLNKNTTDKNSYFKSEEKTK